MAKGLVSKSSLTFYSTENVFFRNAAPFPAEILRVDGLGRESSHGLLPSGMRRGLLTQHGDVWVARAVRPGTASDRRLLLEHRIGAVPIEDCECPQPQFVDCSKGPTQSDPMTIRDPVVFENRAAEPVDVFFYNGTCEELVSWDEVGGVQPFRRKPLLSTQGHSFRLRAAGDRRLLMAHTLSDLVIRGCDEDTEPVSSRAAPSLDGLESLRDEVRHYEREAEQLRQRLSNAVAEVAAMAAASGSRTAAYGGALGSLLGRMGVSNATAAGSFEASGPALTTATVATLGATALMGGAK